MRGSRFATLFAMTLVGACQNPQSAFDAQGQGAIATWRLTWIMMLGGGLILLLVMVLTALAIFLRPERRGWLGGPRLIAVGGIAFPAVTLVTLLVFGLWTTNSLVVPKDADPVRIEITGEQFWWRVRYLDPAGEVMFETANELRLPVGKEVELRLSSADVIHSFWAPSLAGKLDMIPGRVNSMLITAEKPGVYRGQCAEFCGQQHARMAFYAVAEEAGDYEAWLAAEAAPAIEPRVPFIEKGRDLFLASGCGGCHTVRGIEADGTLGPDLTHIGSRRSIGAGILPNNAGTLAGWIASSQHLKPGNRMPSFDQFEGEDLRAVAVYLESLR